MPRATRMPAACSRDINTGQGGRLARPAPLPLRRSVVQMRATCRHLLCRTFCSDCQGLPSALPQLQHSGGHRREPSGNSGKSLTKGAPDCSDMTTDYSRLDKENYWRGGVNPIRERRADETVPARANSPLGMTNFIGRANQGGGLAKFMWHSRGTAAQMSKESVANTGKFCLNSIYSAVI